MCNNSHRIPESLQKILYNQSCEKDPYVYNEGKREKRRNQNRTCTPGNLLHYLGNVQTTQGASEAGEERVQAGLWPSEWRKGSRNSPGRLAARPSWRHAPAGVCSDQVLKLGLQQADLGNSISLFVERQTHVLGVWPRSRLRNVCRMEGRSITGVPLSTQQRRTVGLPTPHSHCAHSRAWGPYHGFCELRRHSHGGGAEF